MVQTRYDNYTKYWNTITPYRMCSYVWTIPFEYLIMCQCWPNGKRCRSWSQMSLTRWLYRMRRRIYPTTVKRQGHRGFWYMNTAHYENTPIQINKKIQLQEKRKFSDIDSAIFSYFCSKHRLWVLVRTASARRFKHVPQYMFLSRNMKK